MNLRLSVMTVGVLFFTSQMVMAQKDSDTLTKETTIENVVIMGFGQKKTVQEVTGSVSTMTSNLQKQHVHHLLSKQEK